MNFESGGITLSEVPCSSERALAVDFAWDEVEPSPDSERDFDTAGRAIRDLCSWVYGTQPSPNLNGLAERAIIICWVFSPGLRERTITDLAEGFGLAKQSLARHTATFKEHFPEVARHLAGLRHQ